MTVQEILRRKGSAVITIHPDQTIREAIKTLVSNSVGSLLVMDDDRIVGILSERDILRANANNFDCLGTKPVAEIMTRDVIIALVEDDLDSVMGLMTERRIRHLPIMADGKLAGIISIGDAVKARAQLAEVEIRHLTDYITDRYPA